MYSRGWVCLRQIGRYGVEKLSSCANNAFAQSLFFICIFIRLSPFSGQGSIHLFLRSLRNPSKQSEFFFPYDMRPRKCGCLIAPDAVSAPAFSGLAIVLREATMSSRCLETANICSDSQPVDDQCPRLLWVMPEIIEFVANSYSGERVWQQRSRIKRMAL